MQHAKGSFHNTPIFTSFALYVPISISDRIWVPLFLSRKHIHTWSIQQQTTRKESTKMTTLFHYIHLKSMPAMDRSASIAIFNMYSDLIELFFAPSYYFLGVSSLYIRINIGASLLAIQMVLWERGTPRRARSLILSYWGEDLLAISFFSFLFLFLF